ADTMKARRPTRKGQPPCRPRCRCLSPPGGTRILLAFRHVYARSTASRGHGITPLRQSPRSFPRTQRDLDAGHEVTATLVGERRDDRGAVGVFQRVVTTRVEWTAARWI